MNFNPFSNNDEDTSFERGMPVSQAAKNVAKTTSNQVVVQADTTLQKATDDVVDFLYAPSTPPRAWNR